MILLLICVLEYPVQYMKRGYYASPPAPSPDKIPIRNAVLCEADSVRVRLRKRGTEVGGGGEGGTTVVQYTVEMLFPPWDIAHGAQRLHLQCTAQYNKKTIACWRGVGLFFDNFGQI
jgi:hypothetical protein